MSTIRGFDIYGTLIDPGGITVKLSEWMSDDLATGFSQCWRNKQLEYSFRRGLMRDYENFAICTRHALDHTDAIFKIRLSEDAKQSLMQCYQVLPAYADVPEALAAIKAAGFRLYGFSNGTTKAVTALLEHGGIAEYFDGVISVDEIKSYKPDPAVYQHFIDGTGGDKSNSWLVSANPFDVLGAINAGISAVWLRRSADAVFDPWGIEPTLVVSTLVEIVERVEAVPVKSSAPPDL